MDTKQTLKWLLDNLPDWPSSEFNFMNIPDPHWHWLSDKAWINGVYSEDYFAVNVVSGEMISDEDFFNARANQRLKPCGMSFNEIIADLSE